MRTFENFQVYFLSIYFFSFKKLNSEFLKLKNNFKDQIKKSTDMRNEVNELIKTVESKVKEKKTMRNTKK